MIELMPRINSIETGDCSSILRQWPDKFFDLCMADFPFGIGTDYGCFTDEREALSDLVSAAMPEILRVSKRAMIACGVQNIGLYPTPDWVLSWVFPQSRNQMPWGYSSWQPILCYGQAVRKDCSDILIETEPKEKQKIDHPCPKSLSMWTELLRRGIDRDNSLILDPLMGSGTTAIAAIRSNCRFVGIDLNPDYVKVAQERIARELSS
jgi:site-specific DNA-methyltransferase (adenine-specific)